MIPLCTNPLNSLAPGRFQFNFRYLIFKLHLVNGGWGMSYEIGLRWMPLDLTDDKSTLVQVIAWCRQATSHYLSQCWPRSMSPNGVTRPQWVKCKINQAWIHILKTAIISIVQRFTMLNHSLTYHLLYIVNVLQGCISYYLHKITHLILNKYICNIRYFFGH